MLEQRSLLRKASSAPSAWQPDCRFDRERLREMAKRARSLGRPEATRHVAQICMELAK